MLRNLTQTDIILIVAVLGAVSNIAAAALIGHAVVSGANALGDKIVNAFANRFDSFARRMEEYFNGAARRDALLRKMFENSTKVMYAYKKPVVKKKK